jgi:hypothetical protein
MAVTLTFYGWSRSTAASGGKRGRYPGRLESNTSLSLSVDDGAGPSSANVPYLLMGPGDVRGLRAGAVLAVAPRFGDDQAETTRCPHVELAAPDLPWRYTPEPVAAGSKALRPWLVLVVGTAAEVLLEPDGQVTLMPTVTAAYDLERRSARWAHVQEDDEPRISRLVSERALRPSEYHLAVVVPAFNQHGAPSWRPGERVTVPAYYRWHFRTVPDAEDFGTLATKLLPIETSDPSLAGLGLAPLRYPTTPAATLGVPGALIPIDQVASTLPPAVVSDLAARRALADDDEAGRPIVGLPRYGDSWLTDPEATGWGMMLNRDPRHRGVAGLGAWAGIVIQEEIASAAADRAGALFQAAAKIRGLTFGLAVSGALWERRLPTTPGGRLMLFGPSLQRMPTGNGTVLAEVSNLKPGRPLAAAIFSSAARRVFRPGTARARHALPGAFAPDAVFEVANTCLDDPPRAPLGLPHDDGFAAWLAERRGGERRPSVDEQLDDLRRDPDRPVDLDRERVAEARLDVDIDRAGVRVLVEEIGTSPPRRPCEPIDFGRLDAALTAAVDPRRDDGLTRKRVLGTITGLGDEPLAPTEFCPDFDLPAWRVLRDHARDWLLPGAGRLPNDRVVALVTNPAFSDAFLVGLNTQALGELRWRNIPIRAGCTPLRRFWERVDAVNNRPAQDITGILEWPTAPTDLLGSPAHVPVGSPGANLVLLFHTPLFRRYPGTLVYLYPDEDPTGAFAVKPNVEAGAGKRVFPSFQGQIDPDFTFFCFPLAPSVLASHWVVIEEVQRGYRFGNAVAAAAGATDGGTFATTSFVDPTRVLIQGTTLDPTS